MYRNRIGLKTKIRLFQSSMTNMTRFLCESGYHRKANCNNITMINLRYFARRYTLTDLTLSIAKNE